MDTSQEEPSTLLSFRKAIASHLSSILRKPSEFLLPLVQQNTGHRKPSHSVFYVVIKRLGSVVGNDTTKAGGGLDDFDEDARQRCLVLFPETREYIASVRMTKDMILFDPVPLRLIQLTIKSIVARNTDGGLKRDLATAGEEDAAAAVMSGTLRRPAKRGRFADQPIIVNGSGIQLDEDAYCSLRRTILTGFVARTLSTSCQGPVKVIMEHSRKFIPLFAYVH